MPVMAKTRPLMSQPRFSLSTSFLQTHLVIRSEVSVTVQDQYVFLNPRQLFEETLLNASVAKKVAKFWFSIVTD